MFKTQGFFPGKAKLITYIVIIIIGSKFSSQAQTEKQWTVLLVKKGKELVVRSDMYTFNAHGFNLYRNCVYNFTLYSGERYKSPLIGIKKDTLIIQNFFNEAIAMANGQNLDTLYLNYKTIDKINIVIDEAYKSYKKVSLDKYNITFKQDTANREIPIYITNIPMLNTVDTITYEVFPILTDYGLKWIYEAGGKINYLIGFSPLPETPDITYRIKNICFIPPMDIAVDEINGLALGMMAAPSNMRDSLKIKGLTIELLTMGMFAPFFGSFLSSDSVAYSHIEPITVRIKGVTLSIGGAIGENEITGFYIGGAATIANKLNGFTLSGIHTIALESKGFVISGLRNQIRKVNGIQIALFNSATQLNGLQIGLWNVNQKRSLPLVNW